MDINITMAAIESNPTAMADLNAVSDCREYLAMHLSDHRAEWAYDRWCEAAADIMKRHSIDTTDADEQLADLRERYGF